MSIDLHDGSGVSAVKLGVQLYDGMKMYAMATAMTTPRGWKIDRRGRTHRLFC